MFFNKFKHTLPSLDEALPGRSEAMSLQNQHAVLASPLQPPYPEMSERIVVGMGCFWGAEKRFWSLPQVISTAVGYSAGYTPNPTYEEVCSGRTGHNEVVQIVYWPECPDSEKTTLETILSVFWQSHDPTQGMRQGNDRGTQYRSGIYYTTEQQLLLAQQSLQDYQLAIDQHFGAQRERKAITTEIKPLDTFYFAEDYHQQYLAKNPNGYCGLGGLGVAY